ncbi:hypothetical protein Syun_027647 [Stephania yunnanensis]|uniref:ABC transmembrane type-1 domain-containing protein n=1 Tax=Stephania yunnanensis TaxID=152371 RepID=A0AAP0EFY2_9MAGN
MRFDLYECCIGVSNLRVSCVGRGIMGYLGNKGETHVDDGELMLSAYCKHFTGYDLEKWGGASLGLQLLEPEHSIGAIGARLSTDAATVRGLVGDALSLIVQNVATAIAVGLNGYIQSKFMKGFSADAKMMYEEASQVANDAVGSIRTVASFCAAEKVI